MSPAWVTLFYLNFQIVWYDIHLKGQDNSEWGYILANREGVNRNQFSSVQSLSRIWLFAIPWITERQASLSITNSQSLPKFMAIESVMPSNHLILCHPLLLLSPITPSIRVFSNESTLRMRWPKYRSFSFSISPCNEHPGLVSFRVDWLDPLAVWKEYEQYENGTYQVLIKH